MASGLGRQPKIEVKNLTENTIQFLLSHTHVSFANSLRRVMIAEVPAFAIDLVQVERNETMLFDEYIAHRLGMIPLRYIGDDDITRKFKFPRDCTRPSTAEEACPECSVEIDLSVKNTSVDEPLNVTSRDLVSHNPEIQPVHYATQEEADLCDAADGGIVIAKLAPGESLKMRCIARLGTGKEHAKWCSCSVATFRYDYEVTIDHDLLEVFGADRDAKCQEFVKKCQPGVFRWDEERKMIVLKDKELCRNWPEALAIAQGLVGKEGESFLTVTEIPERYMFYVETTGSHRPEDIVSYAMASLKKKLATIRMRCDEMRGEMEEDESKGGEGSAAEKWVGEAAAEPYMLNNRDVRGGD